MRWVVMLLAGCGRLGFDTERIDDAASDGSGCQSPLAGLSGAWSMDAADVSGFQVLDGSGGGLHGMLRGSPPPRVAPGRIGEALDYGATTVGFVDLPGIPVGASSTTVSLWFFHSDPNVDEVLVYLPATPDPTPPRYDLWLTTAGGPLALCINTGNGECWGTTDPSLLDRWVHVVAVFANGPMTGSTLFIDGTPVTMQCEFGTCDQSRTVQAPFTIGGSDNTYSWHGLIDDVRFYDRALSATEAVASFDCAP